MNYMLATELSHQIKQRRLIFLRSLDCIPSWITTRQSYNLWPTCWCKITIFTITRFSLWTRWSPRSMHPGQAWCPSFTCSSFFSNSRWTMSTYNAGYYLSQCMRFPTMWHFDKCRLKQVLQSLLKLRDSK